MTGNRTSLIPAAFAMVAVVLLPEVSLGQANDQKPAPSENQDCTAPAGPSQKGDRVQKDGENLSKKLDGCHGVLKAPESGDKGIVTPAPETGNSRVIKPGDVPENANPTNGAAK